MLKQLVPNLQVSSIYDIDLDALEQQGIKGIITDLDNTLVAAEYPMATPELIRWLDTLQNRGFKVVVVSNNNQTRVSKFADPLNVPYIHRAKKPSNISFKKALKLLGLEREKVVVIGDQMFTDVLGGNRMGLYTILVIPIAIGEEGFFTKINRTMEKIALRWMRKKGWMTWEDKQ
jgi:HAD superfamily phosphatase (TIGR01668 family)